MRSSKLVLRRSVAILVVSIAVYFFAKSLGRNWVEVQSISLRPDIYSVLGVLCFMSSVLLSSILWSHVMKKIMPSKPVSVKDAVRVHTASWLLKYVPGQAGSYVNKVSWGSRNGYSKKAITNSFIYENALLLFGSLILSVPVIITVLSGRFSQNLALFVPLLVVVPLVLVLHQGVFYKITNTIFQKLRGQTIAKDLFLRTEQIALLQLEFLLPRILIGVGFVLIARSLVPFGVEAYIPLAAIYILAGVIGLLAIFVPSGLGVREAVIVLLASAYMSPAEAVVVSVAARFYATIADVGLAAIYGLLAPNSSRANSKEAQA